MAGKPEPEHIERPEIEYRGGINIAPPRRPKPESKPTPTEQGENTSTDSKS